MFRKRRRTGSHDVAGGSADAQEIDAVSEAASVPEADSVSEAQQESADTVVLPETPNGLETLETPGAPETPDDPEAPSKSRKAQKAEKREKKSWTGSRLVALIAGIAVVSLLAGVAIMQFIVSPATLAARTAAPEPGPVTASIEERTIENTVVLRGEVSYADSVAVSIEPSGGESRPVVTGHVPKTGAILNSSDVALEIAGRPVIVLPGELPAYRNLSIGMRGPDVTQLKQALASLGYATGNMDTDTFDWDTAAGLGALYEQLGYTPATGGDEAHDALRMAERGVRDANVQVAQAQAMLDEARAQEASNTIGEEAALNSAWESLSDAQTQLGEAQAAVLPTLPSGEVLFLSGLPRRVDSVSVARGDVLSGSPMSVSGATLTITGSASKQDAELLSEDNVAYFAGPNDEELTAKVQSVEASKGSGGAEGGDSSRYTVTLVPDDLTSEQIEALRGTNVRLRIPVASTDGEVLAVPIAALSSGSGGESRVELLIAINDGPNAETENIVVDPGLSADGYVEISSADDRIEPGAKVVVGR